MTERSEEYLSNEIINSLNEWMRQGVKSAGTYMGHVVNVNLDDNTCSVRLYGDPEGSTPIPKVRLSCRYTTTTDINADPEEEMLRATILEIPKEGTSCLFGFLDNDMFLPKIYWCQHLEQILWEIPDLTDANKKTTLTFDLTGFELKCNDSIFTIKDGGFKLNKGDDGLKKTLQDLIDLLVNFKTQSPGGIGTTDPTVATNLNTLKTDLDKYLE